MRYQSEINLENRNNSHTLTIEFIDQHAKGKSLQILDVGCSSGYVGEYLRTLGHYVTGLDITPDAIAIARDYLDEAHCAKVEDFLDQCPDRRYDIIIFGDVLEHVTNAEEVLQRAALALKPNGRVIASIPNIAHVAIRAMLLAGRWDYSELGLLDRDHLRFFTKESIYALFDSSGYEIYNSATTNLPVEIVAQMCNLTLDERCVEIAKEVSHGDDTATTFQYVVAAKLQPYMPRVVCVVPSFDNALFTLRIQRPLGNWSRRFKGSVRYRTFGTVGSNDLQWGDLFVFQRHVSDYSLHLMRALKAHGKRVVFEIDDLLTDIPDFLNHHRADESAQRYLIEAIRLANIVTTTTSRLAKELKKLNPNVINVPNCIDSLPDPRKAHNLSTDSPVTLLVASSDKVLVDMLIKPLKQMLDKYEKKIKLIVIGPISASISQAGLQFEEYPILSYEKFNHLIQTQSNAIGLIPLDGSKFSSCKSPIKFFDYSAAQIPCICSNVPPYSDYVQNNVTGILVDNSPTAWAAAIESLVTDPDLRIKLSDAARQHVVETHMVDEAGNAWRTLIEDLEITREEAPFLLAAAKYPPRMQVSLSWVGQKLVSRRAYGRLIEIWRSEGISGIKQRLLG